MKCRNTHGWRWQDDKSKKFVLDWFCILRSGVFSPGEMYDQDLRAEAYCTLAPEVSVRTSTLSYNFPIVICIGSELGDGSICNLPPVSIWHTNSRKYWKGVLGLVSSQKAVRRLCPSPDILSLWCTVCIYESSLWVAHMDMVSLLTWDPKKAVKLTETANPLCIWLV